MILFELLQYMQIIFRIYAPQRFEGNETCVVNRTKHLCIKCRSNVKKW